MLTEEMSDDKMKDGQSYCLRNKTKQTQRIKPQNITNALGLKSQEPGHVPPRPANQTSLVSLLLTALQVIEKGDGHLLTLLEF